MLVQELQGGGRAGYGRWGLCGTGEACQVLAGCTALGRGCRERVCAGAAGVQRRASQEAAAGGQGTTGATVRTCFLTLIWLARAFLRSLSLAASLAMPSFSL